MQEIERKFLVEQIPPWLEDNPSRFVSQGYLAIDGSHEVRLRRLDDERLLAAKMGSGEIREEVEVRLETVGFEELWKLTESRRIAKRRFQVSLEDGHRAEVDVYADRLEGLVVAEVEFASEEESRRFRPPPWFGRELTGDHRYANQELALGGLPSDEAQGLDSRRSGSAGGSDRTYRLKPSETPSAGMRRIVTGRLEKAAERLSAARVADVPNDFIHGARKDLKKIRSALRLIRAELGDDLYRVENSLYRDAGRLLSGARDAEVKVETLEDLCERCETTLPAGAADDWIVVLRAERDSALGATGGDGSAALAEALGLVEEGRTRVASWQLERDTWDLVGSGIDRAYRRGRKSMRRAAADPTAADIHDWRKRVKDLWYQLRILEGIAPERLADRIEVADRLGDALGAHHDLTVLRDDLLDRDLPSARRAALVAAIGKRQEELVTAALDLSQQLYSEKPKRFDREMRRGWRENSR